MSTPRRPAAWSFRSLLVLGLIVLSLYAGLGMRAPAPPDEPRFVLAARTMVETGQWLLPHRGSELYAEKPPVFMWIQAAFYTVIGDWNIAFLLPSLMAALLTLGLTWDMARRLWNRKIARHAVVALFCCIQFGLMAKRAQIDMVLLAMMTLSLWGMLRHLLQGPQWGALALAGFAAGVGTVTKGVGFLPVLIVLPWLAARCLRPIADDTAGYRNWRWAVLPVGFVAGTAVWLAPLGIALLNRNDPALHAYAHELLFKQTGTRYAAAWHHHQPAWYYLQVMATLWLPGSLLLPWLLPAWWRRCRRGDARFLLPLGWAALVLIFFTLSPGKREVYLLPMLPALALAAAPLLPGLLRLRGVRWALWMFLAVLAATALVTGLGAIHGDGWAQRQALKRAIDPWVLPTLGYWLVGFGAVSVGLLGWLRVQRAGLATVLVSCALWGMYGWGAMPTLDPYSSASLIMNNVRAHIGPSADLGMVGWREQNLLQTTPQAKDFGFKRPLDAQWHDAAAWLEAAPEKRWLLVMDRAMTRCVDPVQVVDIGSSNRNHWKLAPGTAFYLACLRSQHGVAGNQPDAADED